MKIILTEQQIESLKKVYNEQGFWDNLLKKGKEIGQDIITGVKNTVHKLTDEPSKADYIGTDVDKLFQVLNDIDQTITQQTSRTVEYQQKVEAVQIGLVLLGYDLPKFGVDGLFGQETADAVNKFKLENNIQNLSEAALENPLDNMKVSSEFGQRWGKMHHGVDLSTPSGTPIKSPADGKVIDAAFKNNACGGTLFIEHTKSLKTRYCHLKQIDVSVGDFVKQGEVVGYSGGAANDKGTGNSKGPHLHFEVYLNGKTVDPQQYLGSVIDSTITPEMVNILMTKLQQRGVTSDDLKNLTDPESSVKLPSDEHPFTQLNLNNQSGFNAYKLIAHNFISSRDPQAKVTGEMLAKAAKDTLNTTGKYIPPELALAQLTLEGGIGSDENSVPMRTKNPYNIGNTGKKVKHFNSFEDGVRAYYSLIARKYMTGGRTAKDLVKDFKNDEGNSYAAEGLYEKRLMDLINSIRTRNKEIYDQLSNNIKKTVNEEILTEADKRIVIKNSLGFNDDWANEFHRINDKISVWIADSFIKEIIKLFKQKPNINLGPDPKKYVVKFLNSQGLNWIPWENRYKSSYEYINDWFRSPRREQINLKELTFEQAYTFAEEWHESLQIKNQANYNELGDIFIDYRDNNGVGYYWVNLRKSYCSEEAERMGHCARAKGLLFSFRRINEFGEGSSLLTVDYRKGGVIGDFHRHGNKKPTSRFHNYIVDFLINKKYPVNQLTKIGVHKYNENFHLSDLSPENLEKVMNNNQALKYDFENKDRWPFIIDAIIKGEIDSKKLSSMILLEILHFAKNTNNSNYEGLLKLFTDDVIYKIFLDTENSPSVNLMKFFFQTFSNNLNKILENEVDNLQDFINILRTISNNFFQNYEFFCPFINNGFIKYKDNQIEILAQKGFKRTLLSCVDDLDFAARFSENRTIDNGGNIAVKTEEGYWGLVDKNGNMLIRPIYRGVTLNKMDRTNKTYIVKNEGGMFFKYNIETNEITKM